MIESLILKKIENVNKDVIVLYDPDSIFTKENIVNLVVDKGYDILNYEDPDVFRYYYEKNIRLKDHKKVIVRYSDNKYKIPYDIYEKSYRISISLSDIFPKLSYSVISEIYNDIYDELYKVYKDYEGPTLGDRGTKDFIIKNIYGIVIDLIRDFNDLVKIFISIYYRGFELPTILANHLLDILNTKHQLNEYPIKEIISGKSTFYTFLQKEWKKYIENLGKNDKATSINFQLKDIRVYLDNLFSEGLLTPIEILDITRVPNWAKIGTRNNFELENKEKYDYLINKVESQIDSIDSYKEWLSISPLWAELTIMYHDISSSHRFDLKKYEKLRKLLEDAFKKWLEKQYSYLNIISYTKAPIMVHHIPWHINFKLNKERKRKAVLIVIDGMAYDDWLVIKECLKGESNLLFDEIQTFAWIPTITSISRQAIFSGEIPVCFKDTLFSTDNDERQWKNFWKERGYNSKEIFFMRNIKELSKEKLKDSLKDNKYKIYGLVINVVDKSMHGQLLSKKGMYQDIKLWVKQEGFSDFIKEFLIKDYEVYITSDHGNIDSIGHGRLYEGVLASIGGQRVRIYKKGVNFSKAVEEYKGYRWIGFGLPEEYEYIVCEENLSYVTEGEKLATHGGISLEEVIVPFIHVRKGD